MITLKYKKLVDKAHTPIKAHPEDAGYDLVATEMALAADKTYIEYSTGIAVQIPDGYVGLLCARSSISHRDLLLANGIGVIDSTYRGELLFRFRHFGTNVYKPGDKIGQLVIVPKVSTVLEETDDLDKTDRGTGGFGSTGA